MTQRNAIDRRRISTSQEHEIKHWVEALGTTRERLLEAVGRVGPEVDDVRIFLATGTEPIRTVAD